MPRPSLTLLLRSASDLLTSLRELLTQDKVEQEAIDNILSEHDQLFKEFLHGKPVLSIVERNLVKEHLELMQDLVDFCKDQREDVASKMGELARGRKVTSIYLSYQDKNN
ncbi:hypothetical protein [Aliagarivorans taiwanensis]|uniref:hypothetical protein n=1 Tax=Aliagarivorans taiwanensis TaxID=561966 RepID=UPI00041C98F4|nr:hypothetical protein [Aliagarivorans taiwanensis]